MELFHQKIKKSLLATEGQSRIFATLCYDDFKEKLVHRVDDDKSIGLCTNPFVVSSVRMPASPPQISHF